MSTHVPLRGLIALIVFAITMVVGFLALSARLGGPTVRVGSSPVTLRAWVADTQGLVTRSDVRVRGVVVGHVDRVERRGARSDLWLVLDGAPVTLRRDATLRVGTKTAMGEAYVDLDPGRPGGPALPDGARLPDRQVRASVTFDQALATFDAPTRKAAGRAVRVAGRATADPEAASQVAGAIDGLDGAVSRLRDVTSTLTDQAGDLAAIVRDGGTVAAELARRSERITALVRDGRRTLDAVAAHGPALRSGLEEAPRLLRTADAVLRRTSPPACRPTRTPGPETRRTTSPTAAETSTACNRSRRRRTAGSQSVGRTASRPMRRTITPAARQASTSRALRPSTIARTPGTSAGVSSR